MARTQTATCQDCGWQGPVEDTLEFRHLHERVLPGDVLPAGDCPEEGCGGAAMLDVEHDGDPDLRPALEAVMLGLDRLHEAMCTDARGGSVRARVKRLADSARTALAAGPPLQPYAIPAAEPPSGWMPGRPGIRRPSAGSCTALVTPPRSAPTAMSSAASR